MLIKNSFVVSFIVKMYNSIISLVTQSRTWHFLIICNDKFINSVNNSTIIRTLTSEKDLDKYRNSCAGKFSGTFSRIFNKVFSPLKKGIDNSAIFSLVSKLCENIAYIPLKMPGVTVFIWGIISGVGNYIVGASKMSVILCAVVVATGLFLIILNSSLASVISNSLIINYILDKLDINVPKQNVVAKNYSYKGFALIGILIGISSVLFGILPVILAIALFVGIIVCLYFTTLVAVIYVCILPFMPTMVMVAGGICLFICVVAKSILGYKSKLYGDKYVFNMLLLFMSISFAISAVFSFARTSSIKISLVYIAFLGAAYALIKLFSTKKVLICVLNCISAFSFPVSLYGIYQHFTGFDKQNTWIDTEMFEDISGRVVSFFGNPNVFGEYLILIILTSAICFFISKNNYVKFLHLIALACSSLSLVYTYSRGCWIGVIFAVVIFLFISKRKLFAAFCVLGAFSIFFLPDSIITRITSVGNLADSSTSYRVYIWEGTIKMLKDFWTTGIGMGSDAFNMVYPLYAYSAISAPHPHNLYLLILTETGIVGFFAFILIVVFYYKNLFTIIKISDDNSLKIISSGLIAAMSGYLLQGMFDNVWYNYRVFLLFWIFIALGAATDIISRRNKSA